MRRLLFLLALASLFGCGTGRGPISRGPAQGQAVAPPPPPPPVVPADANFVLTLVEAVPTPEADIQAYAVVTVDGKEQGRTQTGPKSQEKKWGAALVPGNHLFKFEVWFSTAADTWTPLASSWQPPERFIRVDGALRTTAALKLTEGGRRHAISVTREPAAR
jgi:hypothetical protein